MSLAVKHGPSATKKLKRFLLISGFSIAFTLTGHSAIAAWQQPYKESIAQQAQAPAPPPTPEPKPAEPDASKPVDAKKLGILKNHIKQSITEIGWRRSINQSFSITFIVAGITLTLIATSLGAVESQNTEIKRWTKFAIVGLGAGAVAAQSLNAAFPVTKKAAEYDAIEWNLKSLEGNTETITTQDELKNLSEKYTALLARASTVEAIADQPKK